MARSDWKRPKDFSAPEGRRRVALEVSYDGRAFCGWQSQLDEKSVQDTIKAAVERLVGEDKHVVVVGSGRTDSGVHAYGQVAHAEFDDCSIPIKAFYAGLNSILPFSVRIKRSWDAEPSFHARYSAMAREYRYFCKEGEGHDCFSDGLVTIIRSFPNIDLLNGYAKTLIGTHDFNTFTSAKDDCPSKVRDIYESSFSWTKSMFGEKVLCYKICGNAFLYHMVRSLVGTMLDMGSRGCPVSEFEEVLASKDRSRAGKTAASDGLYLWRVSYDPEEYRWFEEEYGKQRKAQST